MLQDGAETEPEGDRGGRRGGRCATRHGQAAGRRFLSQLHGRSAGGKAGPLPARTGTGAHRCDQGSWPALLDYLARVQLLSGVPPFDGRKRPSNFIDAQIMADAKDPGHQHHLVDAGRFCPARARLLLLRTSRVSRKFARRTRRTSPRCLTLAGRKDAAQAARRLMAIRNRPCQSFLVGRANARHPEALQPARLVRPRQRKRPASTGHAGLPDWASTDAKQIVARATGLFRGARQGACAARHWPPGRIICGCARSRTIRRT